ncbi:hypothetical protein [Bifidobacterium choloepi]|uniref:DUF5105 domain-containing protein n=1 Tax=Bifidobacterium choloepi TaxID=2614131 RepID=A0A6I5N1C2_9BIFI|nr:hypothetical protein [Bifidobacterium choloepi]NEG69935.1 hypothetical protein [Bifidobacterium choloepi]
MKSLRKIVAVSLGLLIPMTMAACGSEAAEDKVYSDQEVMKVVSKGLESRFALAEQGNEASREYYQALIDAEYSHTGSLKNVQFENGKLQEKTISYVNVLDDSRDVLDEYAFNSLDFSTAWTEAYDSRTAIIKEFVEDYGLTVSNGYQSTLNELVANGTAAAKSKHAEETLESLLSNVEFSCTPDEWSDYCTYEAVVENTSELSYKDITLSVSAYDSDGIKTEEYAGITTWAPGEKVKLTFWTDVDVQKTDISISYYSVAD